MWGADDYPITYLHAEEALSDSERVPAGAAFLEQQENSNLGGFIATAPVADDDDPVVLFGEEAEGNAQASEEPYEDDDSANVASDEPEPPRGGGAKQDGSLDVPRGKGQYFTFTQNLGKAEDIAVQCCVNFDLIIRDMYAKAEIGFFCGGHELAPKTGEHHIQGYIETAAGKRITFKAFHKLRCFIGLKSSWMRPSRGSAMQNIEYTGKAKDEGRWYLKIGDYRNYGPGKSKEMVKVQQMLDASVPRAEIYKEYFETSAKHYRFFNEYDRIAVRHERVMPQVYYVYGPTGTGKSSFAMDKWGADPNFVYWVSQPKGGDRVWWDGYNGQDTVIIDDFYPGFFGRGHVQFMLRMCDRYPLQVPVHGSQVPFYPKTIVFTSNTPIDRIDSKDYSGYEWDETNPLYDRVYKREPNWIIKELAVHVVARVERPRPAPMAPAFKDNRGNITTLIGSKNARRNAEQLASYSKNGYKRKKFELM